MTAPAPGLPQDVAITLAVYTEAVRENAVIPFTVGHLDSRESALLAALRAAILAAMRAATEGSGAASAASAASAAHVAPGGEPVAWGIRRDLPISGPGRFVAISNERPESWRADDKESIVPLFTRPTPPVSASFDAALAALDVEETLHPDRMLVTHAIVGLDDVRAAHAEAVRVAVEKERAACLKACKDLIDSINHDGECPMLVVHAYEVHGAEKCIAAIRARGVAKPRTDGEAATRSGEGAKS